MTIETELERCKNDITYFYNKYVKCSDQRELSNQEVEWLKIMSSNPNLFVLKPRNVLIYKSWMKKPINTNTPRLLT